VNASLIDLGIDSLTSTELANALSREFGVKLAPTLVFSYPTAKNIIDRIKELLGFHTQSVISVSPMPVLLSSTSAAIVDLAFRLPGG
jgi:hypothetical protein